MSDINRRIVTTWAAHGGNVRAVMGDIRSGMMGGASGAREFARQQGLLNNQMRAFGTTLRYAVAGIGVYGAASSVSQLSNIQTQLGLISAIGDVSTPQGRGFSLVGKSLQGLSEEVRDASVEVVQPVETINAAVLNLVSTLEGVPRDQLVPIISDISKAATLAQTPVDSLTQAITGMTRLFNLPQTQQGLGRLSQEFQKMIALVPGGPEVGSQIALGLPQLAGLFSLGGGSPEQLFGFLTTSLKAGGSPATTTRGLQYLVQSLIQPQTSGQRKALGSIGITPEFIAQEGVAAALLRLVQQVRTMGVSGDPKRLAGISEEELEGLQDQFGPAAFRGAGTTISPEATKFLKSSIGRIHGIRSLLTLALQYETIAKDLGTFDQFVNDYDTAVKDNAKAWKRFKDQAQLATAAKALEAMKLDIVTAFEPILNYAAKKATGLAGVVDKHTQEVAFGGAAALGLFGANRILRGVRGRGLLGRGFIGATAVEDAISGGAERGASPQNPLWVMVVGQVFGGGNPAPVVLGPDGKPVGGTGPADARKASRAANALSRLGRTLPVLLPLTIAAEKVVSASDEASYNRKNFPLLTKAFRENSFLGKPYDDTDPRVANVLSANRQGWISSQTAEARLKAIKEGRYDAQRNRIRVEGKADVTVNVKTTDQNGQTRTQKAFVPVDLFGGFAPTKAPQTRGKDRSSRGGSQ